MIDCYTGQPLMKLRMSFINFLNSVPLGWSFLHGDLQDAFELLFDVPSQCARRLADGSADIGLIPVVEYLRNPALAIVPGISIASKHEVKSVLFVSNLPLERVRSVALDTSSRTSAALLRILLKRFHGLGSVSYHESPPDPERMLATHDAALIIGNPALKVDSSRFFVFDLALEWSQFTGLPFVFAFWAVRKDVDLGERVALFYRSRREGLERIDTIARMYSERLSLTPAEIRSYLSDCLDFSLDETNLKGLRLFFELATEEGLVDQNRELEFVSNPSAAGTRDESQTRA